MIPKLRAYENETLWAECHRPNKAVCYGNLFEQYDAIVNFCQKHLFLCFVPQNSDIYT